MGCDRLAAVHTVGDLVDAGLEMMVCQQIQVPGTVRNRVFAVDVGAVARPVVGFSVTYLHCFQRGFVYADLHLNMRCRNRQHTADATGGTPVFAALRRIHGAADQSGVFLGAIPYVGVDSGEPVKLLRYCGSGMCPKAECAGNAATRGSYQRRLQLDAFTGGSGVEGRNGMPCRNRHRGHVIDLRIRRSAWHAHRTAFRYSAALSRSGSSSSSSTFSSQPSPYGSPLTTLGSSLTAWFT